MAASERERCVGFELEYASVPLGEAADIIQNLYGGHKKRLSDAEIEIIDTKFGTFRLELDAEPVKKLARLAEEPSLAASGPRIFQHVWAQVVGDVSEAASKAGSLIAPFEIVTPPVAVSQVEELQELCEHLRRARAKDTKDELHFAFGLHVNPEVESEESSYILNHIKAFALMFPYMRHQHDMDLTRRLSGYAEPYSSDYVDYICSEEYLPDVDTLIKDYERYNPDRNKALDMLPLFAHLNEGLTRSLYGEQEKINARPTFHYRLPNSEVADETWSFDQEWSRWLTVERMAASDDALEALTELWRRRSQKGMLDWLKPGDQAPAEIAKIVDRFTP